MRRSVLYLLSAHALIGPGLGFRSHGRLLADVVDGEDGKLGTARKPSTGRNLTRPEIDTSSIDAEVHSCVSLLRDETGDLDDAMETEAGQAEVLVKAKAATSVSVRDWLKNRLSAAVTSVRQAVTPVYNVMKAWMVDLFELVARGELDDVVALVQTTLTRGITGLRSFIGEIWTLFDTLIERARIKEHMASLHDKVHSVVASFMGADAPQAAEQNHSHEAVNVQEPLELASEVAQDLDSPGGSLLDLASQQTGIILGNTTLKYTTPYKYRMLVLCMTIDMLGMMSYAENAAFFLGEVLDIAWAPLAGALLKDLFDGSETIQTVGIVEELLPFMDFVPTASLAWLFSYGDFVGCRTFRTALELPDRRELGHSCPPPALAEIKEQGYRVVKDNGRGHLYLACEGGGEEQRQKASCVESECKGERSWCFVQNRCGDKSWFNGKCAEMEDQRPLNCPEQGADRKE